MRIYPRNCRLEFQGDGVRHSFRLYQDVPELNVNSVDWPMYQNLAQRDSVFRFIEKETLSVWVPDGIGDLHWVFLKLKSLKKLCGAKRIIAVTRKLTSQQDYYQRGDRGDPFLKMNPLIDEVQVTSKQPFIFEEGFLIEDMGFDYVLDANPFLLTGESIEKWCPDLEVDWDYLKSFPDYRKDKVLTGPPIIYFGNRFAEVTWGGEWSDKNWAILTRHIQEVFREKPVLLGTGSDLVKARSIEKEGGVFINKIGVTSFAECFHLLMSAKIVVGSISGLTILSAAMDVPTIAMWPDESSLQPLPRKMYSSWLKDSVVGKIYYSFGYSSSVNVVQQTIMRLRRKSL